MKNKYTYRLLVQSEEKSRNIMEIAIYGLVSLSVMLSIWQFAEQPLQTTRKPIDRHAEVRITS